jgi:hypothetical protein
MTAGGILGWRWAFASERRRASSSARLASAARQALFSSSVSGQDHATARSTFVAASRCAGRASIHARSTSTVRPSRPQATSDGARRLQRARGFDRDRFAAAVREALPHHAAVHGLGQLEPASRSRQRDPRIALRLFGLGRGGLGVGHGRPVVFCGSVSSTVASWAGGIRTFARNPARRRM